MDFYIKSFSELNTNELYQILQLRAEVFVVEQDCVYQDVDGKDQKSLHVFGTKNNKIIAYTRIFKPLASLSISLNNSDCLFREIH